MHLNDLSEPLFLVDKVILGYVLLIQVPDITVLIICYATTFLFRSPLVLLESPVGSLKFTDIKVFPSRQVLCQVRYCLPYELCAETPRDLLWINIYMGFQEVDERSPVGVKNKAY